MWPCEFYRHNLFSCSSYVGTKYLLLTPSFVTLKVSKLSQIKKRYLSLKFLSNLRDRMKDKFFFLKRHDKARGHKLKLYSRPSEITYNSQ